MKFSIGQAATRLEDSRLLRGEGRYTDDIGVRDGGSAQWVVLLRSDHAHARIRSIDTSAAKAVAGVAKVVTGADVAKAGLNDVPCMVELDNRDGTKQAKTPWPLLATDTVRFVGDPVAAVVATTADIAREAVELIHIDYDALPVSVDTEKTTGAESPDIWEHIPDNTVFDWEIGDSTATDAAIRNASRVIRFRLENNRVVVNSMEPRPVYAEYDAATDRSTLYSSTQGPGFIHAPLTEQVLGIEKDKVRCITPDVGGGFGMKVFLYHEHCLLTWLSRDLKTDLRFNPDRTESFTSDIHGRDHVSHIEAALDPDGVITGLRVTTLANMGAYLSNFGPYIPTGSGAHMMPGCYRIPACYVNVKGVLTNTTPVDAYRGAGRPEAAYLIERLLDVIARETGDTVDAVRRRNFIAPGQMPFTTSLGNTYDSGDFDAVMRRAMDEAKWTEFSARRADAAARGRLRGIGLATYIERCGGGAALPARIEFNEDDTLTVLSGTQNNGQGHQTAFTQLISERLGVDVERIHVIQGDTDRTPPGFTGGSRSVPVGGSAIVGAADEIITKGRRIAAARLEAAEADIEFVDGSFAVAGTDLKMDLFDVARAAREHAGDNAEDTGLDTTHSFLPDEATYPNGCHICELEIDPETGTTEILNYIVVDDFGAIINPLMLAGQVHGGIAQGVGQALLERTLYDDDTGQLLTGSFMDYTMPRADTVPPVDFQTLNIPCANNPLGIKGAGEAGAIGAPPAVVNAVVDALYERTGLPHLDMPLTAERIWSVLQERQG